MTSAEAVQELELIAAQVRTCTLCALSQGRTNAVPGAGTYHAEIMFIGEAPGFHEDKQGLPFVGRSGDYLNKMLAKIGLNRSDVFITNIVKSRPPDNRDPQPEEITACKPYLDRQIELIDPLVIVTLGRYSMARYFPNARITQIHGQPKFADGRAYLPLFHPAAVLRNMGLNAAMEADFQKILVLVEQIKAERQASEKSVSSSPASNDAPPSQGPPVQLSLF